MVVSSFFSQQAYDLIGRAGQKLMARGEKLATAESCTGGLLAALCTELSGSSAWYLGGTVAYANALKIDALGVQEATLRAHGAVSESVVREMALGACNRHKADLALSVSGIAGPGGGTPEKPVGTVWLACAGRVDKACAVQTACFRFSGTRNDVRTGAVEAAVRLLLSRCEAPR